MMKTVISKFKDGVLTSEKTISRDDEPKEFTAVLSLGESSVFAIRQVLSVHDNLMGEVRKLRKQLIASQKEVKARIREREALKKCLMAKRDKITYLLEKNDELNAELYATKSDLGHTEKKLKITQANLDTSQKEKTRKPAKEKSVPDAEELFEDIDSGRAIAAKPVKR